MPRRRNPFNKKTATTFSLVYRAQNDPLIHDPEASDMVFTEKATPNQKIKHLSELDSEFGDRIRENEGEAANYGIYFDDSKYDYMQHLRDTGTGAGEAVFVPAPKHNDRKGKQKGMSLEEQLRLLDMEENDAPSIASSRVSKAESLLPEEMLPSEFVAPRTYQDQQDVPDEIAGFQPDMDPRLREALVALDDEAYVDDDEDVFEDLVISGEELSLQEFELTFDEDEDDGWESDDTVKGAREGVNQSGDDVTGEQSDIVNDDWINEFNKFKKDTKSTSKVKPGTIPSDLQSSVQTGASSIAGLRRKKRKGALTASTGYSMTSSVLARTEALSVLDERFEKLQASYEDDGFNDGASILSGMSGMSKLSTTSKGLAPTTLRSDFDQIMDGFLGEYSEVGHKRVRKEKPQTGLEQLDELRKALGPARIPQKSHLV